MGRKIKTSGIKHLVDVVEIERRKETKTSHLNYKIGVNPIMLHSAFIVSQEQKKKGVCGEHLRF
jgi:hypothetical protein